MVRLVDWSSWSLRTDRGENHCCVEDCWWEIWWWICCFLTLLSLRGKPCLWRIGSLNNQCQGRKLKVDERIEIYTKKPVTRGLVPSLSGLNDVKYMPACQWNNIRLLKSFDPNKNEPYPFLKVLMQELNLRDTPWRPYNLDVDKCRFSDNDVWQW